MNSHHHGGALFAIPQAAAAESQVLERELYTSQIQWPWTGPGLLQQGAMPASSWAAFSMSSSA